MPKPIRCEWCNKLLSEDDAHGCSVCGAVVCDECWGPGGDVCITCAELDEDGDEGEEDTT